jgi:hypothetical protein
VKVGTPIGDYPFEFRRLERRGDTLAIVGIVAGLESSLLVDREDLAGVARYSLVPLAIAVGLLAYRHRRR